MMWAIILGWSYKLSVTLDDLRLFVYGKTNL